MLPLWTGFDDHWCEMFCKEHLWNLLKEFRYACLGTLDKVRVMFILWFKFKQSYIGNISKVHIFWQGHKNMTKAPDLRVRQILVAYSKYKNFKTTIIKKLCKSKISKISSNHGEVIMKWSHKGLQRVFLHIHSMIWRDFWNFGFKMLL